LVLSDRIEELPGKGLNRTLLYIWSSRVVYVGRLQNVETHRYASTTLLVTPGTMKIRKADESDVQETSTALVAADTAHEMDLMGNVLAVFFFETEVDHLLRAQFALQDKNHMVCDVVDKTFWQSFVQTVFEQAPEIEWVNEQIAGALNVPLEENKPSEKLDRRIQKVLQLLRDEPLRFESMETLAAEVNLSATRLSHLFREKTGLTLARYRSFSRMRVLAKAIKEGHTLTIGALDAGFTDSSHFSRVFKDMYGIPPSMVFTKQGEVIIRVSETG